MTGALWVALGSALGGAARYGCVVLLAARFGEAFPWGTLAVNVIGSFAIGVCAVVAGPEGRWPVPPEARQFVMLGLLGGFTTFSAFSLQTLGLMQNGEWVPAAANVLGSVALCLAGVWLGYTLGVALGR